MSDEHKKHHTTEHQSMMVLSSLSSCFGLSEGTIVALLIVVVTLLLGYIFYPALSLSFANSIAIDEETVSSNVKSDSPILLSIVIPAYNEEERLPSMLTAATAFVDQNRDLVVTKCQAASSTSTTSTGIEWIVVSDGSTDETATVVRKFGKETSKQQQDTWRLVELQQNSGKGAAVKAGMLRAKGDLRLMVDADGATDFGEGLLRVLNEKASVVFGSRAHLESASRAQRSLVRTALMYAFHLFVQLLCSSQVHDTQCGFKLFTREAAISLFGNLHLKRWAFDTELVVLAERLRLPIMEVAVPWHEVDGSKLDTSKLALALVSIGMLRDMLCVRACYSLRLWKVKR